MTDYERVEKVIGEWELQGGDAAALVAQRRWVCWKKKPKAGGGFTKPPIDPKTGFRIDIRTDAGRANLLPASMALSAYNAGKCDGIGLVTGEIDSVSLCGLDIDHCLTDDGKILDKFRDDLEVIGKHGYFEVSPSGHGVRGFTLCRKPNGYAVRRGGVEVYFDGQYMTLTGKRVKGADLPLCDDDTAVQHVPRGKITIIQGDSGTGKTAFACALAARVSTNVPLFGSEISAPGPVLMFSVEDDPSTLRGRIEASGGDVSRCFFPDVAAGLSFSDPCIEGLILECGAKLVVFDPLQAFLGGNVDMHRANETRPVLAGLADMAKRNDCAICIISHLNKSDTKGIYKALGSVDIIAASRSVLHVGRNPENDAQCAVIHLKSSNSRNGSSFLYTIGDRGGVTFDGYCSLTYEDLQTAIKRKDTGSNYEQEPLVQVFRKFIADKPGGGFISYDDFRTFGAKLLGFPPFGSTQDFKYKLNHGLSRELQRNDGIIITHGAKQNGARGIRIECYSAPAAYQLNISTEGA